MTDELNETPESQRATPIVQQRVVSRPWRVVAGSFTIVWGIIFILGQIIGKNTDFQFTLMVIHLIWWRMETNWAANETS